MKRFKYFVGLLLTLISLLIGLLIALPATQWGSKQIVSLINKQPGFNLTYQQGSFISTIDFSQAELNFGNTNIKMRDLSLTVDINCLAKYRLCIDKINTFDFQLNVSNTPNTKKEENTNKPLGIINVPFGIDLSSININKASISINEYLIQLSKLSTGISVVNSRLTFNRATIEQLLINIAKKEGVSQSSIATTKTTSPIVLPTVYLPLQVELRRFLLKTLIVNNTEIVTAQEIKLELTAFKENIRLHSLTTKFREHGDLSMSGSAQLITPYTLDFEIESNLNALSYYPKMAPSKQLSTLHGNLEDLSLNINSTGNLLLDFNATVNLLDPLIPYKFDVNFQKVPLPETINPSLQNSSLHLVSRGDIQTQQVDLTALINGFGYHNAKVALLGKTTPDSINIDTFSFRAAASQSDLVIKGDISYTDILQWDLLINSTGLALPKQANEYVAKYLMHEKPSIATNITGQNPIEPNQSGRLAGVLSTAGKWGDEYWFLSLKDSNITGNLNSQKVLVSGDLAIDNSFKVKPSLINLQYGDSMVKVEGYTDSDWHINATVNAPNLQDWIQNIDGSFDSSFTISGPLKNPIINFDTQIMSLKMAELTAPSLSLLGQYMPFENHKLVASLSGESLLIKKFKFEQVNASLKATQQEQSFALQWGGESTAAIKINGDWLAENNVWQGELITADFSYHNHTLALLEPVSVAVDSKQNSIDLNRFCFDGSLMKACMNKKTSLRESGNLAMSVSTNLSTLGDLLLPEQVSMDGDLNGDMKLTWADFSSPSMIADINISSGQLSLQQETLKDTLLQWQKASISFNTEQDKFRSKIALYESEHSPFIDAKLELQDNNTLSGQVFIHNFDIKPFTVFIPELTTLEGKVNSNLTVKGTHIKPMIFGSASITQAQAETLHSSTKIDDLSINFDFIGEGVDIQGKAISADDQLNLLGNANWQEELSLDLAIDSEKLSFILPEQLSATIAPHLKINLMGNKVKLSGEVNVLDGAFSLDKLPKSSVSLSKDVVFIDDNGVELVKASKYDIETDIHFYISEKFKVTGQGFTGRIGGQLNLIQKAFNPLQLFGSLKIPEGKYNAYGQKLEVETANVSFNGPINNPLIEFRAVRDIITEDVVVGIELSGNAKNLQMDFYSSPTMNQSEIASYLVRGKGLDSSAESNSSLTTGIGTSLLSATGVLKELERIPMLNNVEIESTGTQASISGYVNDKVYIKYGIGLLEPINELTIRLYWLNRFWLESVTGLENSASIYYSFDIE